MKAVYCPYCGGRTKRNGRTSSGSQRWRCTACGASTTVRYDDTATRLDEFLGWLLSKDSRAAGGPSGAGRPSSGRSVSFPDGYGEADLRSLAFIDACQDFVFHRKTGRGKTHLAIAVGAAAVRAGKSVRFFTVAQLVMHLADARDRGRLRRELDDLLSADLLVLDELGYVPLDVEGARLLFQVMSAPEGSQSLIVTTHIEFSRWGTVFGDDKMAAAVVDRLVYTDRLVEFNGASYRMENALMLGKGEAE